MFLTIEEVNQFLDTVEGNFVVIFKKKDGKIRTMACRSDLMGRDGNIVKIYENDWHWKSFDKRRVLQLVKHD